MANVHNLTPFKPGQSGNPKGRPKLPDLKQVMADILGEEKDGKSALEAIVAKLRQLAAQGNIKAAEVLLSRGYGLPKQHIDHTTAGESLNRQVIIEPSVTPALATAEADVQLIESPSPDAK